MYRPPRSRRFQIRRNRDVTGVSGVGIVADGVEFPDGTVALRWRELDETHPHYLRGVRATTVLYPNIVAVEALHGHDGATELIWAD